MIENVESADSSTKDNELEKASTKSQVTDEDCRNVRPETLRKYAESGNASIHAACSLSVGLNPDIESIVLKKRFPKEYKEYKIRLGIIRRAHDQDPPPFKIFTPSIEVGKSISTRRIHLDKFAEFARKKGWDLDELFPMPGGSDLGVPQKSMESLTPGSKSKSRSRSQKAGVAYEHLEVTLGAILVVLKMVTEEKMLILKNRALAVNVQSNHNINREKLRADNRTDHANKSGVNELKDLTANIRAMAQGNSLNQSEIARYVLQIVTILAPADLAGQKSGAVRRVLSDAMGHFSQVFSPDDIAQVHAYDEDRID